ncbi:MAG: hypothetical protein HFI16_14175 [Lachnospiraceae bacterium]|nr:hypothetical protein [Lachnospiraceae bacterium]
MNRYSKYYEARDIVTRILFQDFVGPVYEDECLAELPVHYYIMGKLYPQSNLSEALDLARNPLLENDVETYDASVSLSNQNNPSSMGITVTLKPSISQIRVSGGYAFYQHIPFENAKEFGIDPSKWEALERKPADLWKRKTFTYSETINFTDKRVEYRELEGNLQLQVYTHSLLESGERVITIALINENQPESSNLLTTSVSCAFQPVIHIEGIEKESVFTNVSRQTYLTTDPELLELDMLYSDVHCYGQGHGCSVIWDREHEIPEWVESSFFPEFNLLQMKAADVEEGNILSMKFLSTASSEEIISGLSAFAEKYQVWINALQDKVSRVNDSLKETAKQNIDKCQNACDRIVSAVHLLDESAKADNKAFRAFQLANEAMLMQRRQSILKNKGQYDPDKVTWYPFQLAFILHELSSFIEPFGHPGQDIPDREMVDLLWFPTGGGKTEAYLGITAFVIFLRRLRDHSADGVTVIMRYTLRLLTLQQFERASILIFACELLRQKYHLGGSEISIGLWVGGDLTPNNLKEARSGLHKQIEGVADERSNPVQIRVCPWCGEKLAAADYSVDLQEKRMKIRCKNLSCSFHSLSAGLPVHIIDEAIYEHLPTFIVATVDKFAQIPLNDQPAAFFGIGNGKQPPELIIQDELHLISGPLGTMTGLYEAAITKLCERNGVHAKVVASTATIRNASQQILSLYGRKHTQFPPQGLSAKDSFFAVQSTEDDRPARKYLGIMGIGTTATTTLIRVNAAMLFATRYLAAIGFSDDVVDSFWTITGYFNSLRELGSASTQLLDDVQSRFEYLARTKFAEMYQGVDLSRDYIYTEELTSRMSNSEIADIIQDRLKRRYTAENHDDAYDYLLASNMISVGVDVGRLGTMVVAGQPKTNAEYIQATSRVGRDNPGLVVTVYNASRSRDRSHYEQFLKYHSALYRYVEATSLTPFSDRARDRALHALYVTLCRYFVEGLRRNDQAGNYSTENPEVMKVRKIITDYVQKIDPDELIAVSNELDDIEDEWGFLSGSPLVYRSFKNEKKLLKPDIENDRFRTMNSMRSVDGQSGIYLLGGQ